MWAEGGAVPVPISTSMLWELAVAPLWAPIGLKEVNALRWLLERNMAHLTVADVVPAASPAVATMKDGERTSALAPTLVGAVKSCALDRAFDECVADAHVELPQQVSSSPLPAVQDVITLLARPSLLPAGTLAEISPRDSTPSSQPSTTPVTQGSVNEAPEATSQLGTVEAAHRAVQLHVLLQHEGNNADVTYTVTASSPASALATAAGDAEHDEDALTSLVMHPSEARALRYVQHSGVLPAAHSGSLSPHEPPRIDTAERTLSVTARLARWAMLDEVEPFQRDDSRMLRDDSCSASFGPPAAPANAGRAAHEQSYTALPARLPSSTARAVSASPTPYNLLDSAASVTEVEAALARAQHELHFMQHATSSRALSLLARLQQLGEGRAARTSLQLILDDDVAAQLAPASLASQELRRQGGAAHALGVATTSSLGMRDEAQLAHMYQNSLVWRRIAKHLAEGVKDQQPGFNSTAPPAAASSTAAPPRPPVRPASPTASVSSATTTGEELDVVCGACFSGISSDHDPIVLCDGCGVAVHASCYGVPLAAILHDERFYCDVCAAVRSAWVARRKPRPQSDFQCRLCTVPSGARKRAVFRLPTDSSPSQGSAAIVGEASQTVSIAGAGGANADAAGGTAGGAAG
ncbi:MAG: hypothetical protein EOO41_02340, partial [Methanobacteriota archaeon]